MYFWAILRVAAFSYPVGGQVFPKGYHTIVARYVAKWGIAQVCLCEKLSAKGWEGTPKYRKSYFLSIFDVFLGYFEGCCVFLSCRGPSLSQGVSHNCRAICRKMGYRTDVFV